LAVGCVSLEAEEAETEDDEADARGRADSSGAHGGCLADGFREEQLIDPEIDGEDMLYERE
jgi:hypothetical protein